MRTKEIIIAVATFAIIAAVFYFSHSLSLLLPNIQRFSENNFLLTGIIIISSLIDSVNPCAFSILFLTIVFLFSLGKDRKFILKTGGIYIFGIFLIYLLIGIGILQVLSFFNISNGVAKVGAVILIVFALIELIGSIFPSFPIKLKIPQTAHKKIGPMIEKASPATALILGAFVGLFEFPCTGGPYLFILSLLHQNGTFVKGLIFLVIYNIIFVIPLIVALFFASTQKVALKLDEMRRNKTKQSSIYLSIFLIILGLFVFLI